MKRLIAFILLLLLTVFTFSSCLEMGANVDIDEALPHYSVK